MKTLPIPTDVAQIAGIPPVLTALNLCQSAIESRYGQAMPHYYGMIWRDVVVAFHAAMPTTNGQHLPGTTVELTDEQFWFLWLQMVVYSPGVREMPLLLMLLDAWGALTGEPRQSIVVDVLPPLKRGVSGDVF